MKIKNSIETKGNKVESLLKDPPKKGQFI